MGTDEDKRLIEAFHLRLWGHGDVTPIDEVIDPDAVTHWGDFGSNTIEAVRADVERYYVGFTDVETRVDDLLADGDKVVPRWTPSAGTPCRTAGSPPPGEPPQWRASTCTALSRVGPSRRGACGMV